MKPLESEPVLTIRAMQGTQGSLWSEVYQYRQVLTAMVLRNVKLQFQSTYLRYIWGIAQPLVVTLGFIFIKHATSADPSVKIDYPLYLFSGLVFWNYFVATTAGTAGGLKQEAGLLKKIYFPRILVAIVHPIQNLVNLFIAFGVIGLMSVYFGDLPGWNILLLPIVILQVAVLGFGIGCIWSSIALLVEDFNQIFSLCLYVGLFLSPVLFAPQQKNSFLQTIVSLNPMTGSLMAFRACWFDQIEFPVSEFLYSTGISLVFFFIGIRVFRRLELLLVDRI